MLGFRVQAYHALGLRVPKLGQGHMTALKEHLKPSGDFGQLIFRSSSRKFALPETNMDTPQKPALKGTAVLKVPLETS